MVVALLLVVENKEVVVVCVVVISTSVCNRWKEKADNDLVVVVEGTVVCQKK